MKIFILSLFLCLALSAAQSQTPPTVHKIVDPYESWKLAIGTRTATSAESLILPPGFKAELIRSSQTNEDSWIAMAFDSKGRVILARERRGLLRFDLNGTMEVINDSLLECRGLLFLKEDLYANANNSKTLVRLRSSAGREDFNQVTELLKTDGGVGHGRNHLKAGPDGWIYVVHGNNVLLNTNRIVSSAVDHYANDSVISCAWDARMFDGDVALPAGHLLRFNPLKEPIELELIAGGMRNPLDVAFNREGEAFTFDADMEWDVGAPWYVPNRILHLVSGADFGWRRGTSRYPAFFPDTSPSVVDLGLASPASVFFGYGAKFPKIYQDSLFVLDWAYGRILAIHLIPTGSSYGGKAEPFISGRPLNVTDGCIGPDGAFWFITGGRQTQSGLYRVTYSEPPGGTRGISSTESRTSSKTSDPNHQSARRLRRQLESFHRAVKTGEVPAALGLIWPNLENSDFWIRQAARIALEHIDLSYWRQKALQERKSTSALQSLLAMARVSVRQDQEDLLGRLNRLAQGRLNGEQWMVAGRIYQISFSRHDGLSPVATEAARKIFERKFPSADPHLNRVLLPLLIKLNSTHALSKGMERLQNSQGSEELLFYLFQLRIIDRGWTPNDRKAYFSALQQAEALPGALQYQRALVDIRKEVTDRLTEEDRKTLWEHLKKREVVTPPASTRPTVHEWTLSELLPILPRAQKGRSFHKGQQAVIAAQCAVCHRVSLDSAMPFGLLGPDLISVGLRFSPADLLDHVMNPSKVIDEKFLATQISLKNGNEYSGFVESENDQELILRPPLSPEAVIISKSAILSRKTSKVSPMPEGLLNVLSQEEIMDLLAFLQAGGDSKAPAFR